MTDCNLEPIEFPAVNRRRIFMEFTGNHVTSDGGALLLPMIDKKLDLCRRASLAIPDDRDQSKIIHTTESMLKQMVFGLALGYEDLNDHDSLRNDPCISAATGSLEPLASSPTLCRMQNRADRSTALKLNMLLVDAYVESFDSPPKEIILDFDRTDDRVHGEQDNRGFHGYYKHYCFLPLYVFAGERLLCAYLRPSLEDGAKHSAAVLKLLTDRLRKEWPEVRIIFRADGGFCRKMTMSWCERNGVDYIIGCTGNAVLKKMGEPTMEKARIQWLGARLKQREFTDLSYGAKSWKKERRVILKAEHHALGANPRFVVTTLAGEAKALYEDVYCARGEMENRIKEQQLCLFADRTSCTKWWPNQFRMLLSGLGYALLEGIRRFGLEGTHLARARCDTIRLKLLKIGAVVLGNTRRIRIIASEHNPNNEMLTNVIAALRSG